MSEHRITKESIETAKQVFRKVYDDPNTFGSDAFDAALDVLFVPVEDDPLVNPTDPNYDPDLAMFKDIAIKATFLEGIIMDLDPEYSLPFTFNETKDFLKTMGKVKQWAQLRISNK